MSEEHARSGTDQTLAKRLLSQGSSMPQPRPVTAVRETTTTIWTRQDIHAYKVFATEIVDDGWQRNRDVSLEAKIIVISGQ